MRSTIRDSEYYAERLKIAAPVGLFVLIGVLMAAITAIF